MREIDRHVLSARCRSSSKWSRDYSQCSSTRLWTLPVTFFRLRPETAEHDDNLHRCEVTFPRAPELGTQENSYDLRVDGRDDRYLIHVHSMFLSFRWICWWSWRSRCSRPSSRWFRRSWSAPRWTCRSLGRSSWIDGVAWWIENHQLSSERSSIPHREMGQIRSRYNFAQLHPRMFVPHRPSLSTNHRCSSLNCSNKETTSSSHQPMILPRNKCTCNAKSMCPVKLNQFMPMHRSLFEVEMSRVRRKRNDVRR